MGLLISKLIQIPNNRTDQRSTCFNFVVWVEITSPDEQLPNGIVNRVVVLNAIGSGDVVILKRMVILLAEAEVDGLLVGGPAFDHDVLVEAGADL